MTDLTLALLILGTADPAIATERIHKTTAAPVGAALRIVVRILT